MLSTAFGLPMLSGAHAMSPAPTSRSVRLAAFPPPTASGDPAARAHVLHLRPSVSSHHGPQTATGQQQLCQHGSGESRPPISNSIPHTMRKRSDEAHRCRSQSRSQVGRPGRRQFPGRPGVSEVDFIFGSGRRIFSVPLHQAQGAAFLSEVRCTGAPSSSPHAIFLPYPALFSSCRQRLSPAGACAEQSLSASRAQAIPLVPKGGSGRQCPAASGRGGAPGPICEHAAHGAVCSARTWQVAVRKPSRPSAAVWRPPSGSRSSERAEARRSPPGRCGAAAVVARRAQSSVLARAGL